MNPPDQLVLSKHMNVKKAPKKTKDEWKELQAADIYIGPVIMLLKMKQLAQYNVKEGYSSGMRVLLKYRQDLQVEDGLLYCTGTAERSQNVNLIICST